MKWRNQLLALICLSAFFGLGILYFQNWVVQKPFAVIVFVAEGFNARDLAAARLYKGGADAHTSFDSMSHLALLQNASKDFAVPDVAAAAAALATGTKVNNGSLGIDQNGQPLTTLLELAQQRGRATGLISDSRLTNPACAAFYAHRNGAEDRGELARQLIDNRKIDIVMGGGAFDFAPKAKGGDRDDERDLLLELRSDGYDIAHTRAELENIPAWRRGRVFGSFAQEELAFGDEAQAAGEQPTLSDMVRRAVELLQYNRRGYLLVVDAALMRKARNANQGERLLRQLAELDHAVEIAQRYAGARSTIIVCGDVSNGGFAINGTPFRSDSGVALLGLNSRGEPWITWATGPNGLTAYGGVKTLPEKQEGVLPAEPAAFYSRQALAIAEDPVALGSGPGTERLRAVQDDTVIFQIVEDAL